ncbi:MAG: hypothetical protein QOJ37_2481 [Pseudonocardiales bacterium]|nr:hypothetical protein [Pseudonocardiales bacterium]
MRVSTASDEQSESPDLAGIPTPTSATDPAPTARANRPSRICPASSASATLTVSGTAGALVWISLFWYFFCTAVPFLAVFLAVHPSTYRTAGLR